MLRITALLLLAFTVPAAAQSSAGPVRPTLKPSVTVASDIVRIGDLVENAGAVADVAIFRSPDLGTTGTVSAASVLDAVSNHHLFGVDTRGISEIEVTRASRTITREDIIERIARAFAGRYGLGEAKNLSVTFDREPRAVEVEPTAGGDLQVARAYYDSRSRRFDISFDLPPGATAQRASLRYTGSLIEMADIVVPTRPLARGEVVSPSDVEVRRQPKTAVGSDTVGDLDQVFGLALRHPLRMGQPVRRADLMRPQLVQRGEAVTLVYEAPGMRLTMRGQALESGAEGATVNVLNIQSKRTIQGTVTGPGRVNITSPLSRVATIAPPPVPSAAGLSRHSTE
ncbi:MAG TPA: flagellar basal body P-ring formation chaperone FlgA [Xanthobacteraceae bacterium]|jgi:flagella basal body P-ring formation protein FlgA|nr:flagellar basal body P-ring formation chaperone FlgA [Xanthobacteraceae bacterium]